MATNDEPRPPHHRAVIGSEDNFWLYSSKTGFDLTHPAKPTDAPIQPRVTFQTTTKPITVDPAKTALVVIDMQNFFLSPAFGRNVEGAGHKALEQLTENAIPAAREAGIRVVWVNWGLTEKEVKTMPPAIKRAFGFEVVIDDGEVNGVIPDGGKDGGDAVFKEQPNGVGVDKEGNPRHQGGHVVLENSKDGRIYTGLGSWCGMVKDPASEQEIDAGKLLMRDQWNAALYPPLDEMYKEGTKLPSRPDVWIHKNRMSGLWGPGTELEEFLEKESIRTLLFTGVNTDQCVGGTLQDAFSKGYDCVLLGDGAGTTSPEFAQQCLEFNSAKTYGFLASCEGFAEGVRSMS